MYMYEIDDTFDGFLTRQGTGGTKKGSEFLSYKIELPKMTSHLKVLNFYRNSFYELILLTRQKIKLHFELLTLRLNFYFSILRYFSNSVFKK